MKQFLKTAFTINKFKSVIIGQTIGKFLAFFVGMVSSKLFTYSVLEKRNIHNIFGLIDRKQIVVHRTPHWIELLFSVFVGFVLMELFNYLIQSINDKFVWRKIIRVYIILKWKLKSKR
jgi:hypothetical protein